MENRQEQINILERTHKIWCGIKSMDITLIYADPPGRTDCEAFVSIPIEDPDAAIIHVHEWQHIFFRSNLRARVAFVTGYLEQLQKRMPDIQEVVPSISDFIHLFVNALDDLRVSSLWELLYPKSAEDVQDRWRRIILRTGRYRKDVILYMMGLGLGLQFFESGLEWQRYEEMLLDAAQKVMRRGFPACLIAARAALDTILESSLVQVAGQTAPAILAPSALMPQDTRRLGAPKVNRASPPPLDVKTSRAQIKVLAKMVEQVQHRTREEVGLPRHYANMMDTDRFPTGPDPDWKGTQAIVQAALGVSTSDQVEFLLQQSQREIGFVLEQLRNSAITKPTPDQYLLQGLEDVSLRDIKPNMVADQPLTSEDKRLIQVLRRSFLRQMDRRERVLSDSGSELDPTAYIEMLFNNGDSDIFREEQSSRGFSALILLDMSGTMREKWEMTSRACKVLAKAMKFPFSQFSVWGFTSDTSGRVNILRFEDPERGYWGAGIRDLWGLTPLHLATLMGIRHLRLQPGSAQHLFVLSDGMPTHMNLRGGTIHPPALLMREVAKNLKDGREKGVIASGLVVGWDVSKEAADLMFGPGRWRRAFSTEHLFSNLVELVRQSFCTYLRRR